MLHVEFIKRFQNSEGRSKRSDIRHQGYIRKVTLAQTTVEIRKAADGVPTLRNGIQSPHQAKEMKNEEKQRNIPSPLYLLTPYSIYYLSRIQFLAKGCTNTGWLYTPFTPNPS
ncbi:hypothetical protein EVAR_101008_1 [Eumeta japonica]|uniref:Uncharacterized protein n=1 Tax=Eumeta variegata TaxID=151549 RepID=A0A4C1ZXX4_EUMVA|nr:hypothetical protein EVAR_101008_1 [Eumeta japonica]